MTTAQKSGNARRKPRDLGVLIVEDSWNVAQSLKATVEQAGGRVVSAVPSVEEALDVLDAQAVALALVDMNLKDSFADPLVDELIARKIPYVIITAYEALPSNADRAAIARMTKPLDHERIAAVISSFVGTGAVPTEA
jgi:DNA-binding NtrC family response regulator